VGFGAGFGDRVGASTRGRLTLFGGLYFAQGVPWGFVTLALVARLGTLGLDAADIGKILGVALLPWTLKPFLGPLLDGVSFGRWGRRRPLLLACQLAMALTLLALGGVDPQRSHAVFFALVFANSLFAALQDVTTDALAIAVLPAGERGRANGLMSAGKFAGTFAGGSGLIALAQVTGWPATYAVAAGLVLLPSPLVLSIAEPATPHARGPSLSILARELGRSLAVPATLLAVLFTLVSGSTDTFLYPLVMAPLRRSLGLGERQIAILTAMATATAIAGSLLGGVLADRWGRRRAIAAGGAIVAAAHLCFAAATPSWNALLVYQLAGGVAGGVLYASTIALCMDLTNPALPATHFQFFMAMFSVRAIWAAWSGGHLAERLARPTMFVLAAALELAPLALLLPIDPRRAAAAFARPRDAG
jgi:PAT family beta-lactamase induction signal transducer AmpG